MIYCRNFNFKSKTNFLTQSAYRQLYRSFPSLMKLFNRRPFCTTFLCLLPRFPELSVCIEKLVGTRLFSFSFLFLVSKVFCTWFIAVGIFCWFINHSFNYCGGEKLLPKGFDVQLSIWNLFRTWYYFLFCFDRSANGKNKGGFSLVIHQLLKVKTTVHPFGK